MSGSICSKLYSSPESKRIHVKSLWLQAWDFSGQNLQYKLDVEATQELIRICGKKAVG